MRQLNFLIDQKIVIDFTWMEIIHHKKSIAKIWLIEENTWMEIKLYSSLKCKGHLTVELYLV